MELDANEEKLLRSVALQNAKAVFRARERAERELIAAKEALEHKTQQLAQQREWFQVTLSSIGDAVITTDVSRRITFLNPVAEKLTGWKLSEALGQPVQSVFNIIDEQTGKPAHNPIERVLHDQEVVALTHDTALIARDGTTTSIEDSAAPIRDSAGKISGVVMVFHDVTERRRAENALRLSERKLAQTNAELDHKVQERTASLQQANAQLEEFSYSVSHDLRAPLRAIEAYSRFLKDEHSATLKPQAQAYLEKICQSTDQMNRLINDVLAMSRMSRSDIRSGTVGLQALIDGIIEQNPHLQEPRAQITVEAPHAIFGDEVSLSQAISNLLGNAVKFVRAEVKPVVKVWSELRGEQVRLWVEDNGIGIRPDQQQKLFGMFQRLTSDPSYEGTGIGLAIVRKAVERMGGTVGVESGEGAGSRFWLELKKA